MKSFIESHLKIIIITTCIVAITVISGIITFSITKEDDIVSVQSNERDKDKIQIEVVADSVKVRESKEPNSKVIGYIYKNEIYTVISEDKESQYKWLEIETTNGIRGYIVGIEAYVKKLKTTVIIEEEQKPDIEDNDINNTEDETNNNINNAKPNNGNDNTTNVKKTFKVYFNTNGGNSIEPKVVNEWESVGTLPTPTKEGYIFQYWEYENAIYNDEMYLILQNDITLNAIWKKDIPYEEKIRAREKFKEIVEKYGYEIDKNIPGRAMKTICNVEGYKECNWLDFTINQNYFISVNGLYQDYCFYNWQKEATSCYINPDKIPHSNMTMLHNYETILFSDAEAIYNEYIATGYTLEHLEAINYD